MRTTAFRQQVWEILLQIPFGKTSSYGEIAKQIAAQHSTKNKSVKKICAQAVGNAVAHNAISLIIPCHRVIGKNGNLTGFAAGIDKKQKLLALEKNHNAFMPKNNDFPRWTAIFFENYLMFTVDF